jgi:sulfite reductase (NADPH) hemoprotein beta-component
MTTLVGKKDKFSPVEGIKEASNYLRGTILEGLADTTTGAIADSDTNLTKFHGTYQQDDRDVRNERRKQKLERAYFFMVRIRVPGGICTPDQWLEVDRLSDENANGTIKVTTRQAFQLHGVLKGNLKATIQGINRTLLDTLAACGDVNRNVMCNPNPDRSEIHREVYAAARALSEHLSPKTRAYHEIWLDGERVAGGEEEIEPIYGKAYLPRKFKIGVAVPPSNDVDVFTQDLGFIAIVENERLIGYNVTAGGGMGADHNKKETFPRLGDVIGFIEPEALIPVAEAVVTTQRDYGDRSDRKHARLKYTIEDRGVAWLKEEVERRSGVELKATMKFSFERTTDRYGWTEGLNGRWHFTLFIQNGRLLDAEGFRLKSAVKAIAEMHKGDFRLTCNQNLIIANVDEGDRSRIESILEDFAPGSTDGTAHTGLRLNSLACVALPTCGLALSESERMLPGLLDSLEKIIDEAGLRGDAITIRMTGCPNGCARPYNAEIGLIGRGPGRYNLYLGGAFDGTRLNKLYKQGIRESEIIEVLRPLMQSYALERVDGERFGDFCIRTGAIRATHKGSEFHD